MAGRSSFVGLARGLPGSAGLPDRFSRLVQLLARLPGVGEKTAQRYALFLASTDPAVASELGEALRTLRLYVRPCERCGNIAEAPAEMPAICAVCGDSRRSASLLCVVARVQDLLAIERSGAMRGRYFVLGRLLSPLEGVTSADLPLDRLRNAVADGVTELLVATPPSVDGEATALLIAREFGTSGVRNHSNSERSAPWG